MPDTPASFFDMETLPSALITDGLIPVPLWTVTQISLSESYHLPPIGSPGARALIDTHDDTLTLTGSLVGDLRYVWKQGLETIAESSKRGKTGLNAALSLIPGVDVSGLILVTALTIRTDMQVQSLQFGVSAARRDVIDVTISLVHMPPPGPASKLLDLGSVLLSSLAHL
jgi:hypothetical protein